MSAQGKDGAWKQFQALLESLYGSDLTMDWPTDATPHVVSKTELPERERQLIHWICKALWERERGCEERHPASGFEQVLEMAWKFAAKQRRQTEEPRFGEDRERTEWIQDQLGRYKSVFTFPACMIYVQLLPPPNGSPGHVSGVGTSDWMQWIAEIANAEGERCHIVGIHEQAAGVYLKLADETPEEFNKLDPILDECKAWQELLLAELYVDAVIGMSGVITTIDSVLTGMEQAILACQIGRMFYGEHGVYRYNRLTLQNVLYDMVANGAVDCESFLSSVQYDALGTELQETALAFFRNDLHISDTARVLYLHRNSLLYRLEKIREITGYDIRKFDDAVALWTALHVWKIRKQTQDM
jgi:hypothetical protein